jgi:hypothetical protein
VQIIGLGLSQLAHKALHRLIGISEADFRPPNPGKYVVPEPGPELRLGLDHFG